MKRKLPIIQAKTTNFDELLTEDYCVEIDSEFTLSQIKKKHIKESISYSEIASWLECKFRHKLKYIDKIILDGPSEHTEFGQVLHDMLEEYIKTKKMPSAEEAKKKLNDLFEKLPNKKELNPNEWVEVIEPIVEAVPEFFTKQFGEWECVATEYELHEDIFGEEKKFKGYIDAIIKIPKKNKKNSFEYWILDHKTCGWGWSFDKKTDFKKQLQLILYKKFWSEKMKIDLKDIKCAFLLLKRTTKKERCELVMVSVGEKTLEKANSILVEFLGSIKKGIAPKNKNSCRYCVYSGTRHCKF